MLRALRSRGGGASRGAAPGRGGRARRGAALSRGGRAARFAAPAALGLPGAYRSWLSFADEPLRRALLGPDPDDWALADYERVWADSAGARPLDRLLSLNLRTYLVDDLLVKVDRCSMAHGLKVRSPFLDTELAELALKLAPGTKVRGTSLKRVLRAAVADLLPEQIVKRGKRGFGVPLDRWFRDDLAGYVASTLGATDARVRRHLASGPLDALLARHKSGARRRRSGAMDAAHAGAVPAPRGLVGRRRRRPSRRWPARPRPRGLPPASPPAPPPP